MKLASSVSKHFTEVLVTITAGLCMVSVGFTMGWAGPALSTLTSKPDAPFTIHPGQATVLASVMYIGIMLGAILIFILSNKIGRRTLLCLTSIPFLISFLIFSFWQKLYPFYLARFLSGFASGLSYGVAPLYVCEIASKQIRGTLCLLVQLTSGIGMLSTYVLIPYISISSFSVVCVVVAISQFGLSLFIPESPFFLLLKRDKAGAERVLKKLRNNNNVSEEFLELCSHIDAKLAEPPISLGKVYGKYRKPILLSCLVMAAQQSSGAAAMMAFSQQIFDTESIFISSDVCGIIYASCSFTTIIVCGTFVDKIGRKILFQISSTMVIFPLITLGMYYYLQTLGVIGEVWPYLPLLCMLWHVISAGLGLGSLPYLISNEIVPTMIRPLGGCILTIVSTIGGIFATVTFQALDQFIGKYAPLWMFAVLMAFFSYLVFRFLPETKGKSFDEIEELLNYSKSKSVKK